MRRSRATRWIVIAIPAVSAVALAQGPQCPQIEAQDLQRQVETAMQRLECQPCFKGWTDITDCTSSSHKAAYAY
jgi:hypothetical protein